MENTKDRILLESLSLFADRGYEAVSMRDIARRLDLTQGALYRHYSGKRDIFDSILRRMEACDREFAVRFGLPALPFADSPVEYRAAGRAELVRFTLAMFRHWTEDGFASAFRRMLTLEQYRTREMAQLYQQYFGSGVLGYLADLFRASGEDDPERAALEFYAPFYLLLNQYDAAEDKKEPFARLERSLL